MNMNRALTITGAAIVIAVLLSSPTFAQTNQLSLNAQPAPAAAEPSPDTPLDELIDDAVSQEDRARLLLRCIGPPPPQFPTTRAESMAPASEPAVMVDAPSPLR